MENPPIPLHLLPVGQTAVVEDLTGPSSHVQRLREMGVEPGTEIELLSGGSPCRIRVGQHRLGLRFEESTCVLVQPRSHGDAPGSHLA